MKLFSAYLMRPLLLLSTPLCLSSCGLIDRDSAWFGGERGLFADEGGYQAAQVIPDMRIPAELDSYTIDQLFVIPEPYSAERKPSKKSRCPDPSRSVVVKVSSFKACLVCAGFSLTRLPDKYGR